LRDERGLHEVATSECSSRTCLAVLAILAARTRRVSAPARVGGARAADSACLKVQF